jgi:hypothetical protein
MRIGGAAGEDVRPCGATAEERRRREFYRAHLALQRLPKHYSGRQRPAVGVV